MNRQEACTALLLSGTLLLNLACRLQLGTTPTATAPLTEAAGAVTDAPLEPGAASPAPPTLPSVLPSPPGSEPTDQPTLPIPPSLHIAYLKAENVWLWTPGDSPRQVTTSGRVYAAAISSDGKVIAALRRSDEFHTELWAVNADDGGERLLISAQALEELNTAGRDPNAKAVNPFRFAWVPGTHLLAFNTHQVYEGPGLSLFNDLHVVDADNLQLTTILPAGQGGDFIFSPDGTQSAVITPEAISLVNRDGSNLRKNVLMYGRVNTYSEYPFFPIPLWSPDADYLRVVIPPTDPLAQPRPPTTAWQIPADGSPAIQLGSYDAAAYFGNAAMLSPDLKRLAYLRETGRSEENLRELHIVELESSQDILYFTAPLLQFVSWVPDSTRWVFTHGEAQELTLGGIGMQPISLGQAFRADLAGVSSPLWVDADQILFFKPDFIADTWEIRLADSLGGNILIDNGSGLPPIFSIAR